VDRVIAARSGYCLIINLNTAKAFQPQRTAFATRLPRESQALYTQRAAFAHLSSWHDFEFLTATAFVSYLG